MLTGQLREFKVFRPKTLKILHSFKDLRSIFSEGLRFGDPYPNW